MHKRRSIRDSKKAKMSVEYTIALVIGIILLFVVGYQIVYKKIGGTTSAAMPLCNTPVTKCACFFVGDKCPSVYKGKEQNSEMCPPDGSICDDNNYPMLVKAAKREDRYGTCCTILAGSVSESRLKSYRPATTDASGRPIAAPRTQPVCGNYIVDVGEECDAMESMLECNGEEGYFTCGEPGTPEACRCIVYTGD